MLRDPAEGKLKIGIQRFLSKYAFMGGIIATWRIVSDDTIGTMAIGIEGAGFILFYSPKFVNKLQMEQLVAVIHHEARHVVYGHLFMAPEQYPDQHALVIAQEVTVNENIPERLPSGCITLKGYPRLKPNQDTDTRYRKLAKRQKPVPPKVEQGGQSGGQDSSQDELESQQAPPPAQGDHSDDADSVQSADSASGQGNRSDDANSKPSDDSASDQIDPPSKGAGASQLAPPPGQDDCTGSPDGEGGTDSSSAQDERSDNAAGGAGKESQASKANPAYAPPPSTSGNADSEGNSGQDEQAIKGTGRNGKKARTPKPVPTLDDHSRWQQIRETETFARGILESTMQEILSRKPELSDYEKTIVEHMTKHQGFTPGQSYSDLQKSGAPQRFNWQMVLRKYVGERTEKAPSMMRPPRRFPHLVGIIPGSAANPARPKIMVSIDTSGSMSDQILAEISRELTFLARDREVWIVECDAEIHQVYRYRRAIDRVSGRGGTSFVPPLMPSFLRKHRPDVVIFFTDGYGEAPERSPQVPVIWVLTPEGQCPVTWGRVIKMGENSGEGP